MTPPIRSVIAALVTLAAAGSTPAGGSPTPKAADVSTFEAQRAFIEKCEKGESQLVIATIGRDNSKIRLQCIRFRLSVLEELE